MYTEINYAAHLFLPTRLISLTLLTLDLYTKCIAHKYIDLCYERLTAKNVKKEYV